MSVRRPASLFPAQSNIQTSFEARDRIDALAERTGRSRAEVMRLCFDEALDTITLRLGVTLRARELGAKEIKARRAARGDA